MLNKPIPEKGDVLLASGILRHGYGIIPKAVMTDPELCWEGKALYCLFASLSGSSNTVFPSREYILRTLRWSKKTLKMALDALVEMGYITIIKERSGGSFAKNKYRLEMFPRKYMNCTSANAKVRKTYASVCEGGLLSVGYGICPHAIYKDKDIPRESTAKASSLFNYISCHIPSNSTNDTTPYALLRSKKIREDLDIGERLYGDLKRLLEQAGYIRVSVQYQSNLRTNISRFELNFSKEATVHHEEPCNVVADKKILLPGNACSSLNGTEGDMVNGTSSLNGTEGDTVNPDALLNGTEDYTHTDPTAVGYTATGDTINTSSTNTSIINTKNNYFSLNDRIKQSLREKCKMDILNILWMGKPEHQEAAEFLLDVVSETVCSQEQTIRLRQQDIPVAEIRNLCDQLTVGAVDEVVNRFMLRKDGIRSQTEASYKAYLLATFYDYCTQLTLKEATNNESL